ncbi:MAG: ATP-binding cassette domain-containing protein [Treponema sp.]|nr:ATP-binding cassette domain-containing protein [Treponema sp.]
MPCIIEMKNVRFSAQTRTLVQEISYQFEEGKVTALAGPSGGGKSTVLKLAAGLFPPNEGEVYFRGRDVFRMNRAENLAFRKEGAVVFQDSALWANQNLFQILELPLRLHFPSMSPKERELKVKSVAAEVGYRKALDIRPSELSMGEQKLIAFARAMMCGPKLLFLDECTESLDERAAHRLIELIKKMHSKGASIILISHDVRIIRDLADFIVLVADGRIFLTLAKNEIGSDEELSQLVEKGIVI